ncbi:hypothetical protein A3F02_02735 [Candidatus Curtissbacteria bacterium RIFCSPHIGHO2_12_FULL_38_9b]|uniref:Antitoxin SocA-like Panacea domain-containing protein n=2 Tax=Candidatus Curtissiibacteriota TaxID=1752717 RepID=A0A1F5GUH1_9BACT|nr:MAG: hypothetical protein A3A48_03190 [Candidatus Curtissbacteria bacterium RIFCSPLOWO2_01_FULL_37_9]OGD95494.1 MAG: hypothetical protein A3F02_02735 [Candidatus Curtissbacteria bacterium RIFCSPHIGHO2_12_FULL_38_9b]
MKNQYLHLLAKQILKLTPEGITKVRFAKILYFTHKGLVQEKLSSIKDMEFIRMPLGPVPVGFKGLAEDKEIKIDEVATSPLVYDKQLYTLNDDGVDFTDEKRTVAIKRIVGQLASFSTSEMVAIAHKEPSWMNHRNGDEYYIGVDDLKIALTTTKSSGMNSEIDTQHLQARLMEGMIDEIVEESTSLEYPHSSK